MNNVINRILTFKDVVVGDIYSEVLYDTNFYSECVVCDIMASITAVANDDNAYNNIVGVSIIIDGNYVSHGKMGFEDQDFPPNRITVTIPHLCELSAGNHNIVLSVKIYKDEKPTIINSGDLKSTSLEENSGIAILSIKTYPSDHVDYTNLAYLLPFPEIILGESYQKVLSKTYDITEPVIIKIIGSTTFSTPDKAYSPYGVCLKINDNILVCSKLHIDEDGYESSIGTTTISWVGSVNVGKYNIILEAKRWNGIYNDSTIILNPGISVREVSEEIGKGTAFLNVLLIPERTSFNCLLPKTYFRNKTLLGEKNVKKLTTTYTEILSSVFECNTSVFLDLVGSATFVVTNPGNASTSPMTIGMILTIDGEVVSHGKSSCASYESVETNITIPFASLIIKGNHVVKILAVVYNPDGQRDDVGILVNPLSTIKRTSSSRSNGIASISMIFSETRCKNICSIER